MSPKVFLVGATGHIGGAVLHAIHNTYSSSHVQIFVLVRSQSDAEYLRQQYSVTSIIGTLESIEEVAGQIKSSDIVISVSTPWYHITTSEIDKYTDCAPDIPYVDSITKILDIFNKAESKQYYIGTSGAASIWSAPDGNTPGDRIWDDIDDIDDIMSLPETGPHSAIDRIVLGAATDTLKTAIVSPVMVMGLSPSKTHPCPLTFPDYLWVVEKLGCGYTIDKGLNQTSFIHVNDVAKLYSHILSSALRELGVSLPPQFAPTAASLETGVEIWGPRVYYFASGPTISWKDFLGQHILPSLKTHNADFFASSPSETLKEISISEATGIIKERVGSFEGADVYSRHIADSMGTTMRTRASRAEKAFGWKAGEELGIDKAVQLFLSKRKRF